MRDIRSLNTKFIREISNVALPMEQQLMIPWNFGKRNK